jgi:hypothetical protein
MLTPSTGNVPQDADTYDVGIFIPNAGQTALIIPVLAVCASELYQGQGFHALIGRDILERCILIYNGTVPYFSISY